MSRLRVKFPIAWRGEALDVGAVIEDADETEADWLIRTGAALPVSERKEFPGGNSLWGPIGRVNGSSDETPAEPETDQAAAPERRPLPSDIGRRRRLPPS